jgi:hypothetical protein
MASWLAVDVAAAVDRGLVCVDVSQAHAVKVDPHVSEMCCSRHARSYWQDVHVASTV